MVIILTACKPIGDTNTTLSPTIYSLASPSSINSNTPTPGSLQPINLSGFSWGQDSITLRGEADVPYGTFLQSQLYQGDQPISWWPTNQMIQVGNKSWIMYLQAGKNGMPEKFPTITERGSGYYIRIWEKDNPAINGYLPIILQ